MKRIDLLEQPFYRDVAQVMIALQYSVSDYNKIWVDSEYAREKHKYWLEEVGKNINPQTIKAIQEFKKNNEEALKDNPLMEGLLDLYLNVPKEENEEVYKKLYEDFQQLQKKYPFQDNMANYFDLGCRLIESSMGRVCDVTVIYPITLYTAYVENGGRDDDHRYGYLFPVQRLTENEIRKMYKEVPEAFKKINISLLDDVLREDDEEKE